MKKLIALSFGILIVSISTAQDSITGGKFSLGFLGLSSYGWMSPESKNLEGGGVKAGIAFGIYGDYFFAKNYALSIEVLHSTQGFKIKADSISRQSRRYANVDINYKMRSFQIPITLKLRTNEIGYMRYYGQIGLAPTFAYKSIRADYDPHVFSLADDNTDRDVNESENDFDYAEESIINPINKKSFLEEDNVSGFRMPILIGLGGEWTVSGNTAILFGIRYEYGLINMMKAEDAVARRNVFSLMAGVRF